MPAHFENDEKCDGCKIGASVHTIPEQSENGRNLDSKNSLQHFDAKEAYLQPKSRSVSFQKCLKMFCFHHFQLFTRCRFQNVSVRVPFSKSTVFKICRQKMCRFRVNGRPIRRILHRFQNVPASCERSLSRKNALKPKWLVASLLIWSLRANSRIYPQKNDLTILLPWASYLSGSEAFDTIDHEILIRKLKVYGI